MADIVAAGDVAYRLAVLVAAADRLALLVLGQFRFAAELDLPITSRSYRRKCC